jgi:hypothetical protein
MEEYEEMLAGRMRGAAISAAEVAEAAVFDDPAAVDSLDASHPSTLATVDLFIAPEAMRVLR